jgi:uncharacterized protein (TIRG00374 family)
MAEAPVQDLYPITAGGFFLNNILPFRAGEAARIYWTHRRTGKPVASCAAVLGMDRLFDMLAIATLMVLVMTLWAGFPGSRRFAAVFGAATIGGLLGLWTIAGRPERAASWAAALRLPARLGTWARELAEGSAALRKPAVLAGLYVLSVAFWSMSVTLSVLLSRCFGLNISWLESAALTLAFCAGAFLPSAPGYVGVLEAAGVALLTAAGRDRLTSFSFVFSLHLTQMLAIALVGLPSLFVLGERGGAHE